MKRYLDVLTPPSPDTISQSASSFFHPATSSFGYHKNLTESSQAADQREMSYATASSRSPPAVGSRVLHHRPTQVKGEREQETEEQEEERTEEKRDSFGLWCIPPEFFGCDLGHIRASEAFQK